MPSSSSGITVCSLTRGEPLTVVPLVLPRSRTCQTLFTSRNTQCLPETFVKSRQTSHDGRRPTTSSGLSSGTGSPPPRGLRTPSAFVLDDIGGVLPSQCAG